MRNYIALDNAFILGNDGFSDQQLAFFGQSPGTAYAAATATADTLLSLGWTSADPVSNAPIYVLLSHDLISGLLITFTQGSQPAGGQIGFQIWDQITQLASAFGLDPFTSPKLQDVRPWNGKPLRIHKPRGKLVKA